MNSDSNLDPRLAYAGYVKILEKDDGRVPVCVALIDENGDPAILTTQYHIQGFTCLKDYEERMSADVMYYALARMMTTSRETIREYGGTPLEDVE